MNQSLSTSESAGTSQSLWRRTWGGLSVSSLRLAAAERFQAKLLTSLIVAMTVFSLCALGAAAINEGKALWATENAVITLIFFVIPLCFVYIVSRTQHYQVAAWAFIFLMCFLIFALALPDQSSNDTDLLTYLVIPLLFSSIFLPFQGTIALGLMIVAGVLVFEFLVTDAHFSLVWDSPLNYVLLVVILTLIIVYHRDRLEALRQAKIAESERRYRRLLQTTYTGVVIHQKDIITEATLGFAKMLGYTPNEMTGMPLQSIMSDDSAYTKTGKRLDIEVIHNPQVDEYGAVITVTAVRDITDSVQRQRLMESMNELSQAMASKLDARFILDIVAELLAQAVDVTSVHIYQWDVLKKCDTLLTCYCTSAASANERKSTTLTGRPMIDAPLSTYRTLQRSNGTGSGHAYDELMNTYGVHTILQMPMEINDSQTHVIELWESRRQREFSSTEVQMIRQMVNHIAVALNNAQLVTALKEREAQYQAMLAAIPDLVFRQDRHGVYLEVHGDQKSLLVPRDQVVGRSMYDLLPTEWLEAVEPAFQHVLETGELQIVEYAGVPPGHYEARLVRCGDNEVLALVRNITERKVAEAEHLASEERFRQLSENVREVFWMSTHDPRELIYVSPKAVEILGITAEQLIANSVLLAEHVYHEDQANFNQALQTIQQGQAAETEFRFVRPMEREITWIWSRGSPIKDDAGQVYRIVGVLEDITSRKQAENQRLQLALEQEKVRVLERFIQDASHDLKTPLAVITTNLFLIRNAKQSADIPRRLQVIELHVGLLERIIDDLLTMARLDNRHSLEIRLVDLNGILRIIQEGLHSQAVEKELEFVLSLDSNLPPIQGDEAALHRALMNVVENAILYTPPHGHVLVRTYAEPRGVVVEVADSGIGISEADLPRIFDRFFRANTARTHSGTGLGLPIVKHAIEAHGGTIEVTSHLNVGTTFTIYLKRMDD